MKLDIDFSNLENLVKNMGASFVNWVSNVTVSHVETDWKIVLETKGLDVDIKDIEIQSNGSLQYRGEQILLYIKEVSSGLPKFHFTDCSTLKTMKKMKRFYRYVVTQRKDGYFLMAVKTSYEGELKSDQLEHLNVCQNCLAWYNQNYRHRNYCSVKNFDIEELFRNLTISPISQKPSNTDIFSSKLNYEEGLKREYQKFTLDNTNKSQKSYSIPEISQVTLPKNTFNSSIEPISENYVEISPIITQATSVELDIDENTQNFEDMF